MSITMLTTQVFLIATTLFCVAVGVCWNLFMQSREFDEDNE